MTPLIVLILVTCIRFMNFLEGKPSFITYVDIGNKTVAQDEILLKLN